MTIENSAGEWRAIDDIAKSSGLNRSTVARRITKFDHMGLVSLRRVDGRKVVEKSAYDRACEISIDAIQSTNASSRKRVKANAPIGGPTALAQEQARRAGLQADLLKLRLEELRGSLLSAVEVEESMAKAGGAIARRIDELPRLADDLAGDFPRELILQLRLKLKAHARAVRQQIAADLHYGAELDMPEMDGALDAGTSSTGATG